MTKSRKIKEIIISSFTSIVFIIPLFIEFDIIDLNVLHHFILSIYLFLLILIIIFKKEIEKIRIVLIIFILPFILIFIQFLSSYINNKIPLFFKDASYFLNFILFLISVSILLQFFKKEKIIKFSIQAIIFTSLIISIFGILQISGINFTNYGNSRFHTIFGAGGLVSVYLVVVYPILLYKILKSERKGIMFIYTVLTLIITSYIFLLRFRTAILLIATSSVIFLIYISILKKKHEKNLKIKNFLYSFFVIIILSYITGNINFKSINEERKDFNETIITSFDINYFTNTDRIAYLKASIKMLTDYPVSGIGTGAWFGMYPAYNPEGFNDSKVAYNSDINPHSNYLKILSENGTTGFSIYFLFLIVITGFFRKRLKDIFIFTIFLSLLNILLASFLWSTLYSVAVMVVFLFIICICHTESISSNNSIKTTFGDKYIYRTISIKPSIILPILFILISFNLYTKFIFYGYEKEYYKAVSYKKQGNERMILVLESINRNIYAIDANGMPLDYYIAMGYADQKNYIKALEMINSALMLTPENPSIISDKASILILLNRVVQAEHLLINLKNKYINYISPKINLLAIYFNTGNDKEALKIIKEINQEKELSFYIINREVYYKIKKFYDEKGIN